VPFAHRTHALIYAATKIIAAVKIPPSAFIDTDISRSYKEARWLLRQTF